MCRFRQTDLLLALRNLVLLAALATAAGGTVRSAETAAKRHPGHYAAVNETDWSCTYHAGIGAFTCDDALAVMRKYPSF